MTIVFKVSDNIKEKMITYYEPMKSEKTPDYAVFQVKDFDCVTTLYESGKVMFQGIGADIEASIWIEQERILNGRMIDVSGKEKDKKEPKEKRLLKVSTIGSDEVGTGDYFGPIVVCASYVSKENLEVLSELGVKDSKKLADTQIIEIAPRLIEKVPYKAIVFDNVTYNAKYSADVNMNKIKAILHNKVLFSLITSDKFDYEKIVVDQFTPPKSYFGYLKDAKNVVKNITFMTKAEDHVLSVACSSIIARYYFLREMYKLNKVYNVDLPLGASAKVDEVGAAIAKEHGIEALNKIAKINFKNTDKIKELMRS